MVAFGDVYQKSGAHQLRPCSPPLVRRRTVSNARVAGERRPCPMAAAFLSRRWHWWIVHWWSSTWNHHPEDEPFNCRALLQWPSSRPACQIEHNTTSRCGVHGIRGRMIELASYIGTINWLRLKDGCALGHQLQAWNSSNHSPWLMIYPHFSSSMTLAPGVESRLAETFTMPAPPPLCAVAPVDWRRFWAWSALQCSGLHWCTCTVAKCLARLGLIDLCFISARLIHRSWRPLITSLLVRSLIVYKPWFPRIQLNCSWWKRSCGATAATGAPRSCWFKPRRSDGGILKKSVRQLIWEFLWSSPLVPPHTLTHEKWREEWGHPSPSATLLTPSC